VVCSHGATSMNEVGKRDFKFALAGLLSKSPLCVLIATDLFPPLSATRIAGRCPGDHSGRTDSRAVSNGRVVIILKDQKMMRRYTGQMMVQLTAAREFRDNLSVLLSSNSSPATLLRLKLHELCGNNAHTWSRRTGTRGVLRTASTHRARRDSRANRVPTGGSNVNHVK
jgi:hypothetical protein